MINFRDKENLPATIVSIIAIASMVGMLIFYLVVPLPTTKGLAAKQRRKEIEVLDQTKTAETRIEAAEDMENRLTWTGGQDEIAPTALATINRLVAKHKLRLVAFRPQRNDSRSTLNQVPFLLTVEGPFPQIVALVEDLYSPTSKVAVSLTQISNSDASSDKSTGNIGLVAFAKAVEPAAPASASTNRGGAASGANRS